MSEPIYDQTVAESAPGEVEVPEPAAPTEYDENAAPDDVVTNVVNEDDDSVQLADNQSSEPDFDGSVEEEAADGNR